MDLKPKQIELPSRREDQKKKNVISEQAQTIQTEKIPQSYKKSNELHNEKQYTSGSFVGSIFNLVFTLIFASTFFFSFVYPVYMNIKAEETLDMQRIISGEKPLIIGISIFSLIILCMLISSTIGFIRALINVIKYKKQRPRAGKDLMHPVASKRSENETKNEDLGVYVNGRRLTPQETKKFISNVKKVIDFFIAVITFVIILIILHGGVFIGLIILVTLFLGRKIFFNELNKVAEAASKENPQMPDSQLPKREDKEYQAKMAETTTSKEKHRNSFSLSLSLQKDGCGWYNKYGKMATPEELRIAVIILNVFICVCFYVFFSENAFSALFFGLILFFVRRSMVKQIKNYKEKCGDKDADNGENKE